MIEWLVSNLKFEGIHFSIENIFQDEKTKRRQIIRVNPHWKITLLTLSLVMLNFSSFDKELELWSVCINNKYWIKLKNYYNKWDFVC